MGPLLDIVVDIFSDTYCQTRVGIVCQGTLFA